MRQEIKKSGALWTPQKVGSFRRSTDQQINRSTDQEVNLSISLISIDLIENVAKMNKIREEKSLIL